LTNPTMARRRNSRSRAILISVLRPCSTFVPRPTRPTGPVSISGAKAISTDWAAKFGYAPGVVKERLASTIAPASGAAAAAIAQISTVGETAAALAVQKSHKTGRCGSVPACERVWRKSAGRDSRRRFARSGNTGRISRLRQCRAGGLMLRRQQD
jgi:hypothetical protein